MHGNTSQSIREFFQDFDKKKFASPRNRQEINFMIADAEKDNRQQVFERAQQLYFDNYRSAVRMKGDPGSERYRIASQFLCNIHNLASAKATRLAAELLSAPDNDRRKAIVKKYNRFQAVEHVTISNRSRTAAQFLTFNKRKDLYPNLTWVRTRSADPREQHLSLVGVTLPKDHAFWNNNQPGNLYNCKCDWIESRGETSQSVPETVQPNPGLEGNPAETGFLITNRGPHFAKADTREVKNHIGNMPKDLQQLHRKTKQGSTVSIHCLHPISTIAYELKNIDFAQKHTTFTSVQLGEKKATVERDGKKITSMFITVQKESQVTEKMITEQLTSIVILQADKKDVQDLREKLEKITGKEIIVMNSRGRLLIQLLPD